MTENVCLSLRQGNKGLREEVPNMEERLKRLFDFQRFEVNGRLQEVIDEVEACIKRVPLSDGELDYVAAAGVLYTSSGTDRTDILKG